VLNDIPGIEVTLIVPGQYRVHIFCSGDTCRWAVDVNTPLEECEDFRYLLRYIESLLESHIERRD